MTVFRVGSKVEICSPADTNLTTNRPVGFVTEISIKGLTSVSYRVVWYSGGTRNHSWMYEEELREHRETKKQRIGFKG